jgi:hypothetical protein
MLAISLLAVAAAAPVLPSPMSVEVITDVITDQVRAHATIRNEGDRLVISCDPSRYEGFRITVHSRRWLARGNIFTGERPLIFRFDQGPPRRGMWDVTDRRASLIGDARKSAFLQQLQTAERLAVRARDIENHRFDMVFDLNGVRPALEQARAACAASPDEAPATPDV